MPIHRDLEALQDQFSDIQNSFILSVFSRIKQDQFSLFMEWSEAFKAGRKEEAIAKLDLLLNTRPASLSH